MGGGWALCPRAEPIWRSNALLASTANMGAPNFKIMSVNSLQTCVLSRGRAGASDALPGFCSSRGPSRQGPCLCAGGFHPGIRALSATPPARLSWDIIHELCFCRARLLCPLASKCVREQAQRPLPDSPESAPRPIPIQIPKSSDETLSPG